MIATLLTSIRRVLSDTVRGVGHPSLGSVAEVLSWTVLLPSLALLVSSRGANGVAFALILAGATSLTLLVVLSLRARAAESRRPDISGETGKLPGWSSEHGQH